MSKVRLTSNFKQWKFEQHQNYQQLQQRFKKNNLNELKKMNKNQNFTTKFKKVTNFTCYNLEADQKNQHNKRETKYR